MWPICDASMSSQSMVTFFYIFFWVYTIMNIKYYVHIVYLTQLSCIHIY